MAEREQAPSVDVLPLDPARMRRERSARLRAEMERQGLPALLLLAPANVHFAVGASLPAVDGGRALHEPTLALLRAGDPLPHLLTPHPEAAPPELPAERVHPAPHPGWPSGVDALARLLDDVLGPGFRGPLGLDDAPPPLFFGLAGRHGIELADAGAALAPAKLCKSADELECIRRAQSINEAAMTDVRAALRPGLRQTDLSALFLRRIFELGASANGIDPIWQVVPPRLADGPRTLHGDVAFPTVTSDRVLREDDVLFVDTGIEYEGYASDFGRTWRVGHGAPSAAQRDLARRWHEVVAAVLELVRPGARGGDLVRRATEVNGGTRPWLRHFYLVHGVGTDHAEMPLIGTDLGEDFDDSIALAPGMVLVLEPVIFEDGVGGYRAEDLVAVTEDGYRPLSNHPYAPYPEREA